MCRNQTKIDLCQSKSVHDHDYDISYFVTLDFQDFFSNRYMVMLEADRDEFHSNGLSVELPVKLTQLDRLFTYLDRL